LFKSRITAKDLNLGFSPVHVPPRHPLLQGTSRAFFYMRMKAGRVPSGDRLTGELTFETIFLKAPPSVAT